MPKIMLNSVEYTGGGGGDSGMELTYDEYLALPEEEKTNGTTYYIKDINGVGEDQFQPIIYSEEEREIGVWTDGKPLYQKTIKLERDSSWVSGLVDIPHGLTNIDYICVKNANTQYEYQGEYLYRDLPNVYPPYISNAGLLLYEITSTVFTFYFSSWVQNSSITELNVYVTVQYTKTTDTPGSGTWTPQGVPAVHYSENEQVIGTWIDGKTLYGRTFHFANPTKTTVAGVYAYTNIISGDYDYFEVVSNVAYESSSDRYYVLPCFRIISNETLYTQYYRDSSGSIQTSIFTGDSSWTFADIYITIRYTKSN